MIVIQCYGRRCESHQCTPALSRCRRIRENGVRPRSLYEVYVSKCSFMQQLPPSLEVS